MTIQVLIMFVGLIVISVVCTRLADDNDFAGIVLVAVLLIAVLAKIAGILPI